MIIESVIDNPSTRVRASRFSQQPPSMPFWRWSPSPGPTGGPSPPTRSPGGQAPRQGTSPKSSDASPPPAYLQRNVVLVEGLRSTGRRMTSRRWTSSPPLMGVLPESMNAHLKRAMTMSYAHFTLSLIAPLRISLKRCQRPPSPGWPATGSAPARATRRRFRIEPAAH